MPRRDSDGDGFFDDEDCAPTDPLAYPDASERCNGLDDDCDGVPDPGWDRDADSDGFLWCTDCDDLDGTAFPGATDPIDGIDQDCDGTDGKGTPLPPAAHTWPTTDGLFGFALAVADLDTDGCADLLIGQPGDPTIPSNPPDSASLTFGCGTGELLTVTSEDNAQYLFGLEVSLQPGLAVVGEPHFRGNLGRVFLFDESFGPLAQPGLEVVGGGGSRAVVSTALLGDPAQWLLIGAPGPLTAAQFNLVALPRTGLLDLGYEAPDLEVWTDSSSFLTGYWVNDVGDRDGDGAVDLAVGVPDPDDAVYVFPEVSSGHVADAPEVWHGPSGSLTGLKLGGAEDLDGDGLDDGLVYAYAAGGAAEYSGVVYVIPWLGAGARQLEAEAPARVAGELSLDATGNALAADDLDGDGFTDLVVGAPADWALVLRPGKVMVFRGPLQGVLTRDDAAAVWVGDALGDAAGAAVAVGDLDGSGVSDIAIGAPFATGAATDAGGAVYILYDPL